MRAVHTPGLPAGATVARETEAPPRREFHRAEEGEHQAHLAKSCQSHIRDRKIARGEFSEVFSPLFSRPSSKKALKVVLIERCANRILKGFLL